MTAMKRKGNSAGKTNDPRANAKRVGQGQPSNQQFSQVYYQEKTLTLQSCQLLAHLVENAEYLNENSRDELDVAVEDAITFLHNNIKPFLQKVDTEAADVVKDTLRVLQGDKEAGAE